MRVVGNRKLRHIGDHDLHGPESVPTSPRRQIGASDLGQDGGDLDADHSTEGSSCGLLDNPALSAAEVDEGVAIGDSQVIEGPGQRVPGRRHVAHPIGMVVPQVQWCVPTCRAPGSTLDPRTTVPSVQPSTRPSSTRSRAGSAMEPKTVLDSPSVAVPPPSARAGPVEPQRRRAERSWLQANRLQRARRGGG